MIIYHVVFLHTDHNFEEAIEDILDDSAPSFKLLRTILDVAKHQRGENFDIADLINKKYGRLSLTFLQMVVKSSFSDDISEEIAYLLEHGSDILVPGKEKLLLKKYKK